MGCHHPAFKAELAKCFSTELHQANLDVIWSDRDLNSRWMNPFLS